MDHDLVLPSFGLGFAPALPSLALALGFALVLLFLVLDFALARVDPGQQSLLVVGGVDGGPPNIV